MLLNENYNTHAACGTHLFIYFTGCQWAECHQVPLCSAACWCVTIAARRSHTPATCTATRRVCMRTCAGTFATRAGATSAGETTSRSTWHTSVVSCVSPPSSTLTAEMSTVVDRECTNVTGGALWTEHTQYP